MKLLIILAMTALVSLTITTASFGRNHRFNREFTDRHCNTHLQVIEVNDDGDEEVLSDIITGTTSPCDQDDEQN